MDTRRKQRLSTVMNLEDFEDEFAADPSGSGDPEIVVPKSNGYSYDPEWQPEITSSKPGTMKRSRNKSVVISFSKKMKVKSTQSSERATLKRATALKSKLKYLASSDDENDTSAEDNPAGNLNSFSRRAMKSKLKYLESSDDENDTSVEDKPAGSLHSFSRRTSEKIKVTGATGINFEKFVTSGEGNPEDFWLLPNVKKRLSQSRLPKSPYYNSGLSNPRNIQDQVEYFEKQACNNFFDAKDIPWEELLMISHSLKVTPEMISAHFGKNVLTERRLRKGKLVKIVFQINN